MGSYEVFDLTWSLWSKKINLNWQILWEYDFDWVKIEFYNKTTIK